MDLKAGHKAGDSLGRMRSTSAIQSKLEERQSELTALLQAEPLNNDAIHRCRVLIKKLRAWIRLVRPVHKAPDSKAADERLQALGRELGTTRDRQVLKDTLQLLSTSTHDAKAKAACHKLRRRMSPKTAAALSLPSDLRTLGELHLPDPAKLDRDDLRDGLRATYAKTRKLSRLALADTSNAANLHRLRRWVKYLHYQLGLLYPLKKSAAEQPAMMKALGSTLGEIHDLHVLIETADEADRDAQRAIELAKQRMEQLTEESAAKACLLFAAKPKQFMKLVS